MLKIIVKQKTVYFIGTKKYYSLLGACRHKARIKIMSRLSDYFLQQAEIERIKYQEKEAEFYSGYRYGGISEKEFEHHVFPSKFRYKQMRERLAKTIHRNARGVK